MRSSSSHFILAQCMWSLAQQVLKHEAGGGKHDARARRGVRALQAWQAGLGA